MTATLAGTIDVTAKCAESQREMALSAAADTTMEKLLRSAAARFHVLGENDGIDELQLRREGEDQPLDLNAEAGDVLTEGDRVIVELTSAGAAAAREREHKALASAAGTIAGQSVSPAPHVFLKDARHPVGE